MMPALRFSPEIFALLGPNGAGKSTTLGIISSLVNKTSGQVKIMGYDLDHELVQAKMNLGWFPKSSISINLRKC